MPNIIDVGNIWKTLREVDLRPIREQAERMTWIAIVGDDQAARENLVRLICEEPRRTLPESDASRAGPEPVSLGVADLAARELASDLIVLLLGGDKLDFSTERSLYGELSGAGKPVVVVVAPGTRLEAGVWLPARLVRGSTADRAFLEGEFARAVLEALPDRHLSLARYYPVFRTAAAQQLVSETSMANASYALTTGLAESIPILDVPFNVADIVILTKAQAIMAYKLGLALGLSTRWQDHMAAFGSAVGAGFVWRQVARQLVGLIPVWGIIPKVAVAYGGTYVLGEAIMQWYATGRQVTPAMMRQLYQEALAKGRANAQVLLSRVPRPKSRLRLPSRTRIICENCGASNPRGFNYCGTCGRPLGARTPS